MKPVVYLASALAASFAANPAAAQSDPAAPAPPVEGPGIVVTGAGLPDTPATPAYGTVVLDRETLVSTGSGRIEDALSSVAGFQQFRRSDSRSANPSAQGVTLRALGGNASSRAQVLLDGVPMADPFFGYIPFSAIAPERLSSARVTRGGGSGPFGAGALAGTIELTSADDGSLYGYILRSGPGGRLLRIDKETAEILESTDLPVPEEGGTSLAFAYWNGDFYIFTGDGSTTDVHVHRPALGTTERITTLDWQVVGAGVTTCDPDQARRAPGSE